MNLGDISGPPDGGSRRSVPAWLPHALIVVLCVAPAVAATTVVETDPLSPQDQRTKFRLPEGFEIQLVAAEPTIQKPMNMAFDAKGRLWVTHSVEYPWAAPDDRTPRDGLTILEDFGPDGRARKATRFADGLNIPIGVVPLPQGNAAIVWSIPHIWKLSDDDGDGRADRREILYGPFAFDDTHGNQNSFRLGADGWIYANHGFRNHSRVKLRDDGPVVLELKSGNGYRFRPDRSAIEQVSWGQVNPFGMDFDSLGNRFNADCHSKPLTILLRGGRYLSPFGIRNDDYDDGLGPAPETTADGHGSTGIAAVAICDTPRMPADYQGSAFVGNVVTNVIHRDPIAWRGSSPWVDRPETFLGCDDQWFRPVDLAMGPDGCLYVADFYNCIIGHYEVDLKHPRRDRERGRIWRVVWKEAQRPASPPDLTRLSTDNLVALLDDRDESVRRLAFEQIVARGHDDASFGATLRAPAAGEHRRARSLRALARLGLLDEAAAMAAAGDSSRLVRLHLVKAIEQVPGRTAWQERILRDSLADPDPFVRRAAAEAFAACPAIAAVPALVAGLRNAAADDRQLVHALRMGIAASLRTASPEQLAALPVDEHDRLIMLDLVSRLSGRTLATYGLRLTARGETPAECLARVCGGVAHYGDSEEVDQAAAFARGTCGDDLDRSAEFLQALLDGRRRAAQEVGGESDLGRWARWLLDAVVALPDGVRASDRVLRAFVTAADRLSARDAVAMTLAAIRDAARPTELRREAAAATLRLDRDLAVDEIASRLADATESATARVEFARQLAGLDLPRAREAITAAVSAAPAAQQRDLVLVAMDGRDAADRMLSLVSQGKLSARLLQDPQVARRVVDTGVPDAEARIRSLTRGLPQADERIRGIIQRASGRIATGAGSAEAGATVFAKHCATCHRHAGNGGLVGPQLDGVAQRGSERLLEDILDPNRNVDEAFRTTILTLADGRVVSGLKLRDDGNDLVLADAGGREVRVPRAEIEETSVASLSPMPANMADQVPFEGLVDLVAYLLSKRSR